MKNKYLIIIGIGAVAALGLMIFLMREQTPETGNLAKHPAASITATPKASTLATPTSLPDKPETPAATPPQVESPAPENSLAPTPDESHASTGDQWFNAIGDRTDIPVLDVPVDSADLASSLFNGSDDVERKFLTDLQKEELDETVLSSGQHKEASFPNKQSYTIEWYVPENIESLIPDDLPPQAPLYAVSRAKDSKIFEKVKKLVKDFGLKATVLRMNEANYSAFDMQTGDHLLAYDINKDIFEIQKLKVPMTGRETPMNALEWYLYEKGLLRFPYHGVFLENPDGTKVVRFDPDLELPVLRFDYFAAQGNPVEDENEPFLVGVGETIDAVIDRDNNLTELYAFFPNLEKWGDLNLMSKPEIAKLIKEGNFAFGNVEIQNPAALTIEQRQEFYDMAAKDEVKLTEAELYYMECGYFQETEKNFQLFYQPVCIGYGDGWLGDYGATFGAVLSIAK